MTEELKPCPFCGGVAEIKENYFWTGQRSEVTSVEIRHFCPKLDGQPHGMSVVHRGRDLESAVKAWNTRAKPAITDEMVESVADVIGRKRDRRNDGNPNCVGRNYRWLDLEEANEILQAALGVK